MLKDRYLIPQVTRTQEDIQNLIRLLELARTPNLTPAQKAQILNKTHDLPKKYMKWIIPIVSALDAPVVEPGPTAQK